jgi:hypothetical protein
MYPTYVRRSRQAVAVGAGLLLATVLSAAPAGAQAPSGFSSQPDRGSVEIVPLSADLRITRTIVDADGQQRVERETNILYRDSQGRTRTEDGSSVTISDPVTGTTIVLDTEAHTFQRSVDGLESAAPRDDGTIAPNRQVTSASRPLGERVIEGVRAEGRGHTVTVPAQGRFPSRQHDVTLWASTELQLPLRTRVAKDTGDVYEQAYTNIQAGSEPAAALFQIPAGYQEADPAAAPRPAQTTEAGTAQATCPISYLDPVVLISFETFVMYSPVPAVTDIGLGCIIVESAVAWQWPLDIYQGTPLFLPTFWWDAWYWGWYVPWLPYTAFGVAAFAAASTADATIVDSLIVLEVF